MALTWARGPAGMISRAEPGWAEPVPTGGVPGGPGRAEPSSSPGDMVPKAAAWDGACVGTRPRSSLLPGLKGQAV